jgi:hypothetical protein
LNPRLLLFFCCGQSFIYSYSVLRIPYSELVIVLPNLLPLHPVSSSISFILSAQPSLFPGLASNPIPVDLPRACSSRRAPKLPPRFFPTLPLRSTSILPLASRHQPLPNKFTYLQSRLARTDHPVPPSHSSYGVLIQGRLYLHNGLIHLQMVIVPVVSLLLSPLSVPPPSPLTVNVLC